MIKELIKIANELDAKGLTAEADALDEIVREANESNWKGGNTPPDQEPPSPSSDKISKLNESLRNADPMDDVAEEEDAAKKRVEDQKKAELMKKLRATQDWIAANLYVSTDGKSKFPLTADVELNFGPYSKGGDDRIISRIFMPRGHIIVPKGTVFESLDKPVLTKTHGGLSLRKLNQFLEGNIEYLKYL